MPQTNAYVVFVRQPDFTGSVENTEIPTSFRSDGVLESDGVASVTVTASGTGYTSDFDVTFTGGSGSGAKGRAITLGGAVIAVEIIDPGHGYTSDPTPDFSAGAGSSATGTASRLTSIGAMGFLLGQARFPIWAQGLNGDVLSTDPRKTRRRRNPSFSGR